ncbi:unnamed protein product [Leptidea sinapis]|uniref:Uncharacterized protein n=1 Tax=Leptidea sinapis TaxID=189913 RepID=A0A5E4Q6S4_9NEOP|nr:unnamed protein product [Leptidea sinapis]
MTALLYLAAFALLGQTNAIVELNCSDNATCIEQMATEFISSIRQQKAVRLFDTFTIEPLGNLRQARGHKDPLTQMLTSHAISFDWNDFTFKFSNVEDKSEAMDLEIYESRTAAKDDSEEAPKKSNSKVEEEKPEDKTPKGIRRKRPKRRVMQAVIPVLFGMKSAAIAIFSLMIVTVITIKAFFASKLALLVTVGMAAKKLYENYTNGAGFQSQPYLYSQYPIEFPSASSHAYSVNGVSPQFAPADQLYSPTGLSPQQTQDIIQNQEPSAQQSQQAPVVSNSTRAASERWDGYRRRPIYFGRSHTTSGFYSASHRRR